MTTYKIEENNQAVQHFMESLNNAAERAARGEDIRPEWIKETEERIEKYWAEKLKGVKNGKN